MNVIEVAKRYLGAWARRDPKGLVDAFAEDGTYRDPVSGEITGQAIGIHAAQFFSAFPDITLETLAAGQIGENIVAAHWRMPGTNTGTFRGLPPTNRPIELFGASVLTIKDDRVKSAKVYFDGTAIPKQLGMQIVIQPSSLRQARFGYSASMQGDSSPKRPAVFSLTSVQVRTDAEADEVRGYARRIYPDLLANPGFIGIFSGGTGHRLFTASAWEDFEGPRRLRTESSAHQEAAHRLMCTDWAVGTWNSLWTLSHSVYMVRCPNCGKSSDTEKTGHTCPCGTALPLLPYW